MGGLRGGPVSGGVLPGSLVDEAVAFASEAVTVKTREELALRPEQHHIALARQHRDMGVRSTRLEELVVEKRRELEESLVRIEELQAPAASSVFPQEKYF